MGTRERAGGARGRGRVPRRGEGRVFSAWSGLTIIRFCFELAYAVMRALRGWERGLSKLCCGVLGLLGIFLVAFSSVNFGKTSGKSTCVCHVEWYSAQDSGTSYQNKYTNVASSAARCKGNKVRAVYFVLLPQVPSGSSTTDP